ncbi:hypothetical protein EGW08_001405 [Elysia chlorotica]|uniref:Centrosomal protein of 76 kDa n=1 Tax=Elysia chlorotica TaxID=188477 RepID=A0A3S1BWW5_ELYCH|nr:hypothetical protein EGW08_001405 [Elysia chlorotica]
MALPQEKIAELKQIIHSQVSQMDIQNQIRNVVSNMINGQNGHGDVISEADVINQLRQGGVVDEVMRHIQVDGAHNSKPAAHFAGIGNNFGSGISKKANIDPSRRYLYLNVQGGKAFLEHLNEPDAVPGQKVSAYFTLHIYFRNQRFRSRPVACAVEPEFDEGFLLELHKEEAGDAGKMADIPALLSMGGPIHLVLIKTDSAGETTLLSSQFFEWRPLLTSKQGSMRTSLEMLGTGNEARVPVGVLEIQLELFPKPGQVLEENVVRAQMDLERSRQADRERLFLVYAKQWWKEFLQIRDTHQDRLVKMFAQDENGVKRPVSSYVKPLRAGRLLDTPREAARFVSLMHHEKLQSLGGGDKVEQWTNAHAFLCRNRGDCEDHAVLLCSLLLGFGLDAYICVGTKVKGSVHVWVMTVSADGRLITFWESLNGHRYVHEPINPNAPPMAKIQRPKYPYKTIGCIFNHQSFYANSQASDSVEVCQFDIHNEAHWKSMSSDAIVSVCGSGSSTSWPVPPPLSPSTLDHHLLSNDLEQQLKILVVEHRRDQGLTSSWDDQLSYILTPALAAYETERITGITAGNEEFQDAIRLAVPEGQTFKGYPIQFTHRNARKAFTTCLRAPVCEEIINCRGDQVRLAVRVRVFPYPESACATWIMFACKFKSVL